MTFPKAFRLLLGFATLLIVVWAFIDVGTRIVRGQQHGRPAELTILHWGSTEEIQIMQALVDRFERLHPDIKIHRVHTGDFNSKLKTMFASGDTPDLFYLPPDMLPELAGMDLLEPLDAYIDAAGRDEVLGDFFPVLLDVFRYDGRRTGAGSLYGLPKDFTTAVMYVNVDLFNEAGVPVPYGGWTWDEYEDAMRRISALSTPQRRVWGGMLNLWPATLLNIIWTHGGDFFETGPDGTPDFEAVAIGNPEAQAAMELVRRVRLEDRTVFNTTGNQEEGGQEFVRGNVGSIGPIGRWVTPTYRTIQGFEFDVVPVPHVAGRPPASQLFTVAWAMNSDTPDKDAAFTLLRFLVGAEGQAEAARLGLAIPSMQSVAHSDAFLDPQLRPANSQAYLDAIPHGRIQQHPPFPEFTRIVNQEQAEALQLGRISPQQAAVNVERQWQNVLDSPLRKDDFSPINWWLVGGTTLAILGVGVGLLWNKARKEKLGAIDAAQERAGFTFIAPWIIGFLILTAGPMIVSLILAFSRWTAMTPMTQAEFVGVANFAELFARDATFTKSLWVTAYYVILAVPLTQVLALAVALLMNSRVRGITVFRTIWFVPSVVSGVALAVLWLKLFNVDYGLINTIFLAPLTWVGIQPPDWLGNDAGWAGVPAFVLMTLWGVGGGMVIYLAGLKGIPASLYEAAYIDGAGPMRRLFAVTIPQLSPLIFFNVVMGLIASFQVFTQAKVMTDGGPGTDTLFYVLNLYRQAFEFHNMGYASAMAWILFLIVLALTAVLFRGSRGLVHYEGLKS